MEGITQTGPDRLATAGGAPLSSAPHAARPDPRPRRLTLRLVVLAFLATVAVLLASVTSLLPARHAAVASRPANAVTLSPTARLAVSRGLGAELAGYRLSPSRGGFLARNPRQGLTSSFGARGATVSARDGAQASIVLRAIGSGTALRPVAPAQPLARGNRVEYRRGAATEWFSNGPAGVEQGFTIQAPPAGTAGGALTLALGLSGTLTARPGTAGSLMFTGADGKAVLRYGDLSVTDARGTALPARMTLPHGRVLITVEAKG